MIGSRLVNQKGVGMCKGRYWLCSVGGVGEVKLFS
ncbi:hypothetical protein E2C01_059414 [Portunus trituberculatus]|uniref:Uncharacterized protein n=1 Tax=Portunus trituberculatus TaxID=210409 RepID=A0A5B7GY42_PORTR|nr:hypothetical protein [Portunus trituberculatus]